jgi:serine phosphatase RsbU (regulator of sigma subunit)
MYAVFDPASGRCQVAVGGHPAPLVYRGGAERVETVPAEGALLGAFADQQYEQTELELGSRDAFVAYTDGVVEARAGDELYGRARLTAALARHGGAAGAGEIARALLRDAQSFGLISDDTVVFVLAPAMSEAGP